MQDLPVSRKRATLLLAFGGYINNGILIVQGLVLAPMYLHFIGAHLYGLWLASGGILGMLGVVNFGISSMLIQRIASAYGKQDMPKVGAYFVNGLAVYAAITLVFVLIGIFCSYFLASLLSVGDDSEVVLRSCFQLATVAAGTAMFNECLRAFPQALLRPGFSIVTTAVARVAGIVVTGTMLYRSAGLWALPTGMLAAECLITISGSIQAIALCRRAHITAVLDRTIVKEYLSVGSTMFLARLGSTFSREADPLLITLLLRPEVTTAYVLTRRAADIVSQMLAILYGAIHGAFSHLVGKGNTERAAQVATTLLVLVFGSGLVGLATYVGTNRVFVSLWVGAEFVMDQQIVLMIGIAFLLVNLRNAVFQLLNGFGVYQYTSRIIIIEGAAKVLIAAVLIQSVGIVGAPLSLIIVSIASALTMLMKLKGSLRLLLGRYDLYSALLVAMGLFAIGNYVAERFVAHTWAMFATGAVGFAVLATVVVALPNWGLCKSVKISLMPKD